MTTTHPTTGGMSQCEIILGVLKAAMGEWVPMPCLVDASGSYAINSRTADLNRIARRNNLGWIIENRTEREGTKCHSFYRLTVPPTAEFPEHSP